MSITIFKANSIDLVDKRIMNDVFQEQRRKLFDLDKEMPSLVAWRSSGF